MERGVRIGLNLLHAQPEIGGGWNYIANLVAGLAEYAGDHEFVAFVTDASAVIVPSHPQFRRVRVPLRATSRSQRVLYENFRLPALASRMQVDVLHWFANTCAPLSRVANVVTVYDLLAFTPAAPWGMVKLAYLRTMTRFAVSSAERLLPISNATGVALRTRLHARPERITVIPPVLPRRIQPQSAERVADFKKRHALPDHYWLYVAHFYSHKNHKTLVEAYQHLTSLDGVASWPLVLRGDGSRGLQDTRRQVHEAGLDGKVLFLPRLDDTDLPALYTGASALVFPSTFEGSGIPVIEAMACGCPVVATAQPAVVESGRDAIWAIEHPTPAAFCQAMRTMQSDAGRRAEMSKCGLERAVHFRSDAIVPLLLEVYAGTARRQDRDSRH
jgi:glycosyltransferase involved in cell wall biosynthesis